MAPKKGLKLPDDNESGGNNEPKDQKGGEDAISTVSGGSSLSRKKRVAKKASQKSGHGVVGEPPTGVEDRGTSSIRSPSPSIASKKKTTKNPLKTGSPGGTADQSQKTGESAPESGSLETKKKQFSMFPSSLSLSSRNKMATKFMKGVGQDPAPTEEIPASHLPKIKSGKQEPGRVKGQGKISKKADVFEESLQLPTTGELQLTSHLFQYGSGRDFENQRVWPENNCSKKKIILGILLLLLILLIGVIILVLSQSRVEGSGSNTSTTVMNTATSISRSSTRFSPTQPQTTTTVTQPSTGMTTTCAPLRPNPDVGEVGRYCSCILSYPPGCRACCDQYLFPIPQCYNFCGTGGR